jgi:hypothetical protein
MKKLVAILQGSYYVATGLWPLLNMASFEAVSGPKTDDWLVKTVGVLVTIIGSVLIYAGLRAQIGLPIGLLAIASAAGLAGIDFFYAMRGVIWPIYMLDGVGEVVLIVLWLLAISRDRAPTPTPARQPPTR